MNNSMNIITKTCGVEAYKQVLHMFILGQESAQLQLDHFYFG